MISIAVFIAKVFFFFLFEKELCFYVRFVNKRDFIKTKWLEPKSEPYIRLSREAGLNEYLPLPR